MKSNATGAARGKSRRFPIIRVVPRIAYYQKRWNKDGTKQVLRLAEVGAEHIVSVNLRKDEDRHEQLGPHTFVMRPMSLVKKHEGRPRELRFMLQPFHHLLGLLPDWDYNSALQSASTDGTPREYTALLMLTVQRKRRERTIVIPIQKFDQAHLRVFKVALRRPNGDKVTTPVVRLGGVDCTTVDPDGNYVFAAAPMTTFIVQTKPGTLPAGFALPKRRKRLVDLRDPAIPQPFVIVLRKT